MYRTANGRSVSTVKGVTFGTPVSCTIVELGKNGQVQVKEMVMPNGEAYFERDVEHIADKTTLFVK